MMDALSSAFIITAPLFPSSTSDSLPAKHLIGSRTLIVCSSVIPNRWSLSDGDSNKPKLRSKYRKTPVSDDNARRIMRDKAQYLSFLRKKQGSRAQTPKWITRTPEQMVRYLQDDRNGHLYGKHVVAAIKKVRALSQTAEGQYDMRMVMGSFVGKLSFREMCVVLKEQRGWRQVRDFFDWMKLQLCYSPSVIVYTIVLRAYGQTGLLKMAEQTFLEMLEVGCEPDEIACGTMLCSYARWGRIRAMLTFYSAVRERSIILPLPVFNFMLSSLQKKSLHKQVVNIWHDMVRKGVVPSNFTYTVVVNSLVKEGMYEEAFKTFDEMRDSGYVPEEMTYGLLISLSAKHCKKEDAIILHEDMKLRKIVPSNYTCASLLSLYYRYEDYSKALSLFLEMSNQNIQADEVIYGLVIRIYGKLGLFDDAQKTFQETKQLGILTDEKTYLAMAQVLLKSGKTEEALETIELMKSAGIQLSRFAYVVSLQCYVRKEDIDSAESTFLALSKTGQPDARSCNDMLNLYLTLDAMEKAKDFIGQMRKYQVQFDEELYKTVMKVFCKEGMVTDATTLTKEMATLESFKENKFILTFYWALCVSEDDKQYNDEYLVSEQKAKMALGLLLDLYLANGSVSRTREIVKLLVGTAGDVKNVNQFIRKLVRAGDASKAETLINELNILGCGTEEHTVASLISHYGKQHMLKKACEMFAEFEETPACGRLLYNSMINAYNKCNKHKEAWLLYKQATEKGYHLGAVAVSIILTALGKLGKYEEAEQIINESFKENMELDTVAYNTFIKAMLEGGKLKFASSIYERMLSMGVPPSIQTYNTMISVYGQDQKLDKAIKIFDVAGSSGLSLDEKTYMNLVNYYGKFVEDQAPSYSCLDKRSGMRHEALLLFAKMQEEGIKPGTISYNIMINVYASSGLYQEAVKLFQAMQRNGCLPDSYTYLSLIRAYAENLRYSEAEKIIRFMREKGMAPSCGHFNVLFSAFAKAGEMSQAKRVYQDMLTAGLKPDVICFRTMLRGYMDYGLVEEGIDFFENLSEIEKRDRFIMSTAVLFYKHGKEESKAVALLDTMKSFGIPFLSKLELGSKLDSFHSNLTI